MKNLGLLLPVTQHRNISVWATVTDDSPLRIRLDGDTTPLPFAPDNLVGTLAIGERVWVSLVINADPDFHGRRAVVTGKSGGMQAVLDDLAARVAVLETGPNAKTYVAFSAGEVTNVTSYADLAGAAVTIVKRKAATKLHVALHASFVTASSGRGVDFGVQVDATGTDYTFAPMHGNLPSASARLLSSGLGEIAGLSAASHVVRVRWRAVAGSGDVTRYINDDFVALTVTEVTG